MNRNLIIGVDCLLGRRLLRVQKLIRDSSDAIDSLPVELGLVFEDEFYATFLCDPDTSLAFYGDSISPLLMGDYGDYIVVDVDEEIFSQVRGEVLSAAFLIESDGVVVGVKFAFANKGGLNILNISGELRSFAKIPQAVRMEGKYRLVPLR